MGSFALQQLLNCSFKRTEIRSSALNPNHTGHTGRNVDNTVCGRGPFGNPALIHTCTKMWVRSSCLSLSVVSKASGHLADAPTPQLHCGPTIIRDLFVLLPLLTLIIILYVFLEEAMSHSSSGGMVKSYLCLPHFTLYTHTHTQLMC